MMKPIAPDIKSPLYPGPVGKKPPMPPAPDIRSPLLPGPVVTKSKTTAAKSKLPLGKPRTGGDMLPPGGMKNGGMVSASKRADGCAVKGKTRGRIV